MNDDLEVIGAMHRCIVFEKDKHEYYIAGRKYPSVSDIISPITQAAYGAIPKYILHIAQERGTAVHLSCQAYDELEFVTQDIDMKPYVDAYVAFVDEHVSKSFEYIGSEIRVHNSHLSYCGTIDKLYWDKDTLQYVIVDLKTGSKANLRAWEMQMGAYIEAIKNETGEKCSALVAWLKNDGTFECYRYERSKYDILKALVRLHGYMKED